MSNNFLGIEKIISYFPLYGIIEYKKFQKKIFNKSEIMVFDAGCGTNTDIPYFFDLISRYNPRTRYLLFEFDKNIHWLNILEKRIAEEGIGTNIRITFLNGKFETIFTKKTLFFGNKPPETIIKDNILLPNTMDIIFMHSNMLHWLDFFNSDFSKAIKNISNLLKNDGLLVLTQREGQPQIKLNIFEKYGLYFSKGIKVFRRDRKIEYFTENPDTLTYRAYIFSKNPIN